MFMTKNVDALTEAESTVVLSFNFLLLLERRNSPSDLIGLFPFADLLCLPAGLLLLPTSVFRAVYIGKFDKFSILTFLIIGRNIGRPNTAYFTYLWLISTNPSLYTISPLYILSLWVCLINKSVISFHLLRAVTVLQHYASFIHFCYTLSISLTVIFKGDQPTDSSYISLNTNHQEMVAKAH